MKKAKVGRDSGLEITSQDTIGQCLDDLLDSLDASTNDRRGKSHFLCS